MHESPNIKPDNLEIYNNSDDLTKKRLAGAAFLGQLMNEYNPEATVGSPDTEQ